MTRFWLLLVLVDADNKYCKAISDSNRVDNMSGITVNRRQVMLTAASVAAGVILPTGSMAFAQAASAASSTAQGINAGGNIGYYRFRVGDISATVLSDGLIGGPPQVYASDASEAELEEVLRQAFLPTDHLTLNLNTLLIETNGRRILLEAGAGQTMGPLGGRIFDNLAAIGLRPDDIDVVVISHTHPDHVGNLRKADGRKAFPRATVFAPVPIGTSSSRTILIFPTCRYLRIFVVISPPPSGRASRRSPTISNCTKPAQKSFPA
ncbi:hypothetical protein HSBAA_12220 [Vreelandella sulfidaeris]|uniref:Metallo-beta-lactamase domain-containing protein n=1 Tax=Vreelandella sulfidaeris TaxID=115553 RepID=A0A455U1R6_9GAMM|nr:hypothetical protein HSBAA_12220 [Halomonas sulfidaeris]